MASLSSVAQKVVDLDISSSSSNPAVSKYTPKLSRSRRAQTLNDVPFDNDKFLDEFSRSKGICEGSEETILYVAFGSNLCAETFRGKRGIKPLSEVNILVPELELTFDLPGVPYQEPCFSNSRYRTLPEQGSKHRTTDYHKDRWHKGLVGVCYEVTKADYATIIATEGGGASYHDIVVDCYEIPTGSERVNPNPLGESFKAHTLYCPQVPSGVTIRDGRISRPDPSYAQPSARYMKLLLDGAQEHDLPLEYQDFLASIRPYVITTKMQQLGRIVFIGFWGPIVLPFFAISKLVSDKQGRVPKWYSTVMNVLLNTLWTSYDNGFKQVFGDGERTQEQKDGAKKHSSEKLPLLSDLKRQQSKNDG